MVLLSRGLAFAAIVAVYLGLGWLNLQQAAQVALLGVANVLAVSAWTTLRSPETKVGKACVLAMIFVFLLFMGYLGFLREFFGVAADDANVTAAIFGSDRAEAGEFLEHYSRPVIKHVIMVLGLTALFAFLLGRWPFARRPEAPGPSPRAGWITAGALSAVFVLVHVNPSMRNMDPLLYFFSRYATWKDEIRLVSQVQVQMAKAGSDPQLESLHRTDDGPRTIVFMLSESVTRRNFPYAGYPRNTAPQLGALGEELVWFSDVLSSDPSTFPALCKILTPSTLAEPHLWLTKPDLFLMARKAGYKTFWLSNHSTDGNGLVSLFVSRADKAVLTNRGKSRGEGSFDEVLLPHLGEALKDPSPYKLILVHLLGAHPAYFYRYPKGFGRFNRSDDAVTRGLKASSRAPWAIAARNFYDNALLYSDHVLKQSLDLCRASDQPVAWLFVPDHGQDVAHLNNFSGHNYQAQTQFEIPIVFWHSGSFPAPPVERKKLAARPYQTDVLDHTLLGLMGIAGHYYDSTKDLLGAEFQPSPRTMDWKEEPLVADEPTARAPSLGLPVAEQSGSNHR